MQARFTQGNVMRHIAIMSFTSAIGLAAMFVVSFVDLLFIARLGNRALAAAAGYAGTVLFFTQAISIGASIAAGTLVGRSLGEGKPDLAKEYATSVLQIGMIFYIPITIFLWFAAPYILSFLGAKGETLNAAIIYLKVLIPSIPFMMIAMVSSAILRARGDAKNPMNIMLIASIVNAVLDPIFIFDWGLGLGIGGAALASVISRLTMMGLSFYFVRNRHHGFAPMSLPMMRRDAMTIFGLSVPAILTNFATPVGSVILVKSMSQYGDQFQAALAVINQIVPVFFGVVFALSGAVGPIIAQNYGAKLYDRIRQTVIDANLFNLAWVVSASILLIFMQNLIINGFKLEGDAADLVHVFCNFISFSFVFAGAVFVSNAAFNNLGHPFYSTIINWIRNTIGLFPFVIIGQYFFDEKGILIGQAVGTALTAVVAVWLSLKVVNRVAHGLEKRVRLRDTIKRIPLIHALYNKGPM